MHFLEYEGKTQSLLVRGFDFSKADNIYKISDSVVEGTMPSISGEVILGKNLIEEYGFKVGDKINIILPDKTTKECKITGFFDLKVAQINNSWCITTLSSAQELFNVKDVATSIEMQALDDEVFSSDLIAQNLSTRIGNIDYKITDWKSQNEQLLSGLQGQSISSLMIQIFVMLSVILGISSVLAITVMQKSKQIGMKNWVLLLL